MTPTSSASNTSAAFATITVGRSSNAISLLVPKAPSIQTTTDLKARAYDHLSDLLIEHAPLFSCAELTAAFNHIPCNSYNANIEATTVSSGIRSSFFTIDHLIGLGFRDSQGQPVTNGITFDPTTRPPDLCYFAF